MKYNKLLLATLAGTAGLAAVASQAMPLNTQSLGDAAAQVLNIDFREHDDDDHREGHRRHGDDDRRHATSDRSWQGQDHDDDEDEENDDDEGRADRGGRGADMNQSVNPPSNGLFTPGSKPRVQMN